MLPDVLALASLHNPTSKFSHPPLELRPLVRPSVNPPLFETRILVTSYILSVASSLFVATVALLELDSRVSGDEFGWRCAGIAQGHSWLGGKGADPQPHS